jgi:hypothetical protein
VVILLAGKVVAAGTPAELARPRGVEIETDGAHKGEAALRLWTVAYLGVVGALALAGFARRDL